MGQTNIVTRYFSLILMLFLVACQKSELDFLSLNGATMGTHYSIKIVAKEVALDEYNLHATIKDILQGINQSMSTYIDDSELSRFNQTQTTAWQLVSPDLYHVIKQAVVIGEQTSGAFDPTIGLLVNLWGFGASSIPVKIPNDALIQSTQQHTGYKKIKIHQSANQIAKIDLELALDLSAIAKGFAIDKIADYLDQQGIEHYLVEIGGDLISKGQNARQQDWQIGIEKPNPFEQTVQRVISLPDIAMATSGDYRNYYEKDGVRYTHVIDPNTGKPITHKLASVTVLHQSAMVADAMATAFMVLGETAAMRLANQLKLAVYMIVKTEMGLTENYNDYFKPYLTDSSFN